MNERADILENKLARAKASVPENLCRRFLVKILSRLDYGTLVFHEGAKKWVFGSGGGPEAHIYIHDPLVYRRVLFGGSIGAGETYIDKLWDTNDLPTLVRIMVGNMDLLDRMDKGLAWILKPVDLIHHLLKMNNRKGSKKNILAHYDLGNDMYKSFLDPAMMYSSAIYPHQGADLSEAQEHKLEILCRKLDLKPTDTVIEIGSGWGGFAVYAARNYGCHVTTTTISDAQYYEAEKRIAEAGLDDRVTLLDKDYRDLEGTYNKLVSVEMIEAVGHRFLPGFFRKCADLLIPGGKMVLQAITIADQKYKQYIRGVDFIQRHIFPGGCVPSLSRMVSLIAKETDMVVRHLDDFGLDYARTIRDWRHRFRAATPGLRRQGYDERFSRLWDFYLCYCQGGFQERSISVVHLTATRPERREQKNG